MDVVGINEGQRWDSGNADPVTIMREFCTRELERALRIERQPRLQVHAIAPDPEQVTSSAIDVTVGGERLSFPAGTALSVIEDAINKVLIGQGARYRANLVRNWPDHYHLSLNEPGAPSLAQLQQLLGAVLVSDSSRLPVVMVDPDDPQRINLSLPMRWEWHEVTAAIVPPASEAQPSSDGSVAT